MFKRVMVISIIAAAIFVLISSSMGCKGTVTQEKVQASTSETEATATTVAATETTKAAEEVKPAEVYVMVTHVWGVPYWIDARWGWEDAGKYFNVTAEYTGHDDLDPVSESRIMDELIARGVNGIALCPCDQKAMNPAIERAINAGIPVVTFCSEAIGSKSYSYIGQSNYRMGEALAETLSKAVNYKGEVGISYGGGNPSQEERLQAYKDVIAKYPDMKIVQIVSDEFDLSKGVAAISAMMQAYPDIVGIGGGNATSGACAAQACIEAGKKPGDIKVIACDNNDDVLKYIKEGWITASIATKSYLQGFYTLTSLFFYNHAEEMMPQAKEWKAKGIIPLPDPIDTSIFEINKDNADLFIKGE